MSIVGWFQGKGPSGFGYNSTAEEVVADLDLRGKVVLITGVNSGLGAEAARVMAAKGATIVGLARTIEKATAAVAKLGNNAVPVACELSEPDSVRGAVQAVKDTGLTLDVILCNAGIMALPKLETKHGLEMQFLTNHIGHFILVTGLLDVLALDGRVVMLSSLAHKQAYKGGIEFDNLNGASGYTAIGSYGQSKLANLLFAKELAKRLPEGQAAIAVHPGVIPTNLGRHLPKAMNAIFNSVGRLFTKTIPQGAATETWASVHPDAAKVSGEYLADCNVERPSRYGEDADLAKRLWVETERIVEAM